MANVRRVDPVAAARASADGNEPLELGRYTLLDRIGRGGFGVVYRAHDPLLGREVATKLLRSKGGRESADALVHEARMAAQLQHPNVVRIFDVGRLEGDWSSYGANVFIVMELLDGYALGDWLRQETRTPEAIVEVFLQAADGLAAAHLEGIVHCDIKPANVFVTSSGEVKVLDFGLSRHSTQRPKTTLRTEMRPADTGGHRVIVGTKPYMAPETHVGQEPDVAADQYSFALALVEALTGHMPFTGGRGEMAIEKLRGFSPEWLKRHGVPRRLVPVLMRATRPDPSHRYPGMDAFADDLRRWLRPQGTKWWVGAGVLALLAAVGVPSVGEDEEACELEPDAAQARWHGVQSAVDASWPAHDPGRQRFVDEVDAYVEDWREAAVAACSPERTAAVSLDHARVCLRERLGRLDAVLSIVVSTDEAVVQRLPELASQFVSPGYCLDPERAHELPPMPSRVKDREQATEIRDLLARARAHHAAGSYAEGLRLAKLGLVWSTGGFEPVRAEAMYETGILTISTGDMEGGAEYIEQAYLAAEGRKHDRLAAAAAVRLVSIYGRHLVQKERARAWARRSEVAIERLADQSKFRAALAYNLGLIEYSDGSLDLAREHFEAALELYEERGDTRDARVCRMSLGAIEESKGESEAALELFKEAYAGARSSLGLEHPDTAAALTSVAGAQSSLGKLQVARENLEAALATFERTYGPDHHTVASTLVNMGNVEFDLGRYDAALEDHERALKIFEDILPAGHPRTAITIENIAAAHLRLGRHEEARAGHARVLDMRREHLDPASPLLANAHANLGLALAHLGRDDESQAQFDEALAVLRGQSAEADRASIVLRRAVARRLAGSTPIDDVRRAIAGFERARALPQLAEAKFELAKLLVANDASAARESARASLVAFRSMGAQARAEPVKAWLAAHAAP